MNTSPLGIAVIQFFEDYADKAYRKFPHEPWTCGWGHTGVDVIETTVCTPEIALQWLKDDLLHAERVVNLTGLDFTQHQFDALVSLTYNIGIGNFANAHELQRLLRVKQWGAVADHFLAFDKVNGKDDRGILKRRRLERALFLDGVTV